MATMSLAAYSLFPHNGGVPAVGPGPGPAAGPADTVRRCTPRHMDVTQGPEAVYSLAGLSLFPSVPVATTETAATARSPQTSRPNVGGHQKSKSAPTTTRSAQKSHATAQNKHSFLATPAVSDCRTTSTSTVPTKTTLTPRTPRRLPRQSSNAITKPLVLNATPALSPLPQYSPYDTARQTSGAETCVRRARSSTVIGETNLPGPPTSVAARVAKEGLYGWPVPPTDVVKASSTTIDTSVARPVAVVRKTRLLSVVTSASDSEPESPQRTSPPTPPPSKPLPPVPNHLPSSYLAFPYIEHRQPRGMRKHRSVGVLRSTCTIDQPPGPAHAAPATPVRQSAITTDNLQRMRSFDCTNTKTLLPALEIDTPTSLPPSLTSDNWSPASSRLSSDPPTPQYTLAKVDFGPCSTLDKLNFDWELASSIHTAGTTRDSIDYFLHPLPGASAASLESGERARRRRSKSASRPSRLGASANVAVPEHESPTRPLPELPRLSTAAEMVVENLTLKSQASDRALSDINGQDRSAGRLRSSSSPIWRKVKAGLHLPKLLRPKSWEKISGVATQ